MKVVILTVEDAKKTLLEGGEKLAKTDLLVIISTKAKSEMPAEVKAALTEIKAETEFVKIDSASDKDLAYAYYAGFHDGKGHTTYIVATDKTKVPKLAAKSAKVLTGFKSITEGTASGKTGTSAKKPSSSGKKTSKKEEDPIAGIVNTLSGGDKNTKKVLNQVVKKGKKYLENMVKENDKK